MNACTAKNSRRKILFNVSKTFTTQRIESGSAQLCKDEESELVLVVDYWASLKDVVNVVDSELVLIVDYWASLKDTVYVVGSELVLIVDYWASLKDVVNVVDSELVLIVDYWASPQKY